LALLQVGFSRRRVTASSRTLLPSDFTLASTGRGGMFLCHFPFPINRDLGVTQHPAQRSPDFPPFFPHEKNGGHPVCMALRWNSSIGRKEGQLDMARIADYGNGKRRMAGITGHSFNASDVFCN